MQKKCDIVIILSVTCNHFDEKKNSEKSANSSISEKAKQENIDSG